MKKLILIPLLFLLLLPAQALGEGRVVGGENASIKSWPSTVSLVLRKDGDDNPIRSAYWGHYCTGTLITKQYVLTAGHCEMSDEYVDVVIGRGNLTKINSGERIPAMITAIYDNLDANGDGQEDYGGDLALIKLVRPSTKGKPIGLKNIKQPLGTGSVAHVAGWGYTETESPKQLQTAALPLQSDEYCAEAYPNTDRWNPLHFLPGYQICAGYPGGGPDACMGDSGGPLMQNGALVGVVTFGSYYCGTEKAGVYVRVARYKNWIKGWIKRFNNLQINTKKKPVREKAGWTPKRYVEWSVIDGRERICSERCRYFSYSLSINSNRQIQNATISHSSSATPLCPGNSASYGEDYTQDFNVVFDERCAQSLPMVATPGGGEVRWEGWSAALKEDPCPIVTISATIGGQPFEESFGACDTPFMAGEVFQRRAYN